MPYTSVARVKNGASAINYCVNEGVGHNGHGERNAVITTHNMLPGVDYERQMRHYWDKARTGHTTQIISVLQSFSREEFNPDDDLAGELVNAIGVEFLQQHYPGRQGIVFTQRDGKSGLWHNHVLISDVDMKTLMGCSKEQYHFPSIKQWTNDIAQRYTILRTTEPIADKQTRTERAKVDSGEYSVRDDIKQRVRDAMIETRSEADFETNLLAHGINGERRHSNKYGDYYTYELLSPIPEGEKQPRNTKARSYKLGTDYGIEALQKHIAMSKQSATDTADEIHDKPLRDNTVIDIVATPVDDDDPSPKRRVKSTVAKPVAVYDDVPDAKPEHDPEPLVPVLITPPSSELNLETEQEDDDDEAEQEGQSETSSEAVEAVLRPVNNQEAQEIADAQIEVKQAENERKNTERRRALKSHLKIDYARQVGQKTKERLAVARQLPQSDVDEIEVQADEVEIGPWE